MFITTFFDRFANQKCAMEWEVANFLISLKKMILTSRRECIFCVVYYIIEHAFSFFSPQFDQIIK